MAENVEEPADHRSAALRRADVEIAKAWPTPENVEPQGCIWCKGRPLNDHDCRNFEQFTPENVEEPT